MKKIFRSMLFGLSILVCLIIMGVIVMIPIYLMRNFGTHLDNLSSILIGVLTALIGLITFALFWNLILIPQGGQKFRLRELFDIARFFIICIAFDEFTTNVLFRLIYFLSLLPYLIFITKSIIKEEKWYFKLINILFTLFLLLPILIWIGSGRISQDLFFLKIN